VKSVKVVFFIVLLVNAVGFSQRKKDFFIEPLLYKTTNSLYKTITFVDSREDTASFGFIQKGFFKRTIKVIPTIPLSTQLQSVLNSSIDKTALNGELLFDLRRLQFSEIKENVNREIGYCYFHALMYAKQGEKYYDIRVIDTIISVYSKNATEKLLYQAGKQISDFLQSALLQEPVDSTYFSLLQVLKMDSIEKSKLPLYCSKNNYKDGIYYGYNSFANQTPDLPIEVNMKNGRIKSIMTPTDKMGEYKKVPNNMVYAIVNNNIPYIVKNDRYCMLIKKNGNFYFTLPMIVRKSPALLASELVLASASIVLFTLVPAIPFLLTSVTGMFLSFTPMHKDVELQINHVNGKFIRMDY
jgi:hypothetical protein